MTNPSLIEQVLLAADRQLDQLPRTNLAHPAQWWKQPSFDCGCEWCKLYWKLAEQAGC